VIAGGNWRKSNTAIEPKRRGAGKYLRTARYRPGRLQPLSQQAPRLKPDPRLRPSAVTSTYEAVRARGASKRSESAEGARGPCYTPLLFSVFRGRTESKKKLRDGWLRSEICNCYVEKKRAFVPLDCFVRSWLSLHIVACLAR